MVDYSISIYYLNKNYEVDEIYDSRDFVWNRDDEIRSRKLVSDSRNV